MKIIDVVLHDDQSKFINKHKINMSQYVQDSLDEWMYEVDGGEWRKEINKRKSGKFQSVVR